MSGCIFFRESIADHFGGVSISFTIFSRWTVILFEWHSTAAPYLLDISTQYLGHIIVWWYVVEEGRFWGVRGSNHMRRTRGTIYAESVTLHLYTYTYTTLPRQIIHHVSNYILRLQIIWYISRNVGKYDIGYWLGHTFFGIRELRWIRNLTMQKWSKNTSTYLQIWTSIRRLSKKFTIYLRFDFDGQGGRKETRNILFHLPSEFWAHEVHDLSVMKSHFFVNRKAVCNKLVWNIYSVIEWNLYTSKTHSGMLQELPMIHKEEYSDH